MGVTTAGTVDEAGRQFTKYWWLFLITGIAWVLVSFMVLAMDPTSVVTIGYLVGFVVIAAGVNELMALGYADSWKWLHGVLGVVFIITGFLALLAPFQTFGILALLVGWYLLFKGTFDIVFSIAAHGELRLWGLLLAAGIAQLLLGIWAIGYPGRSAWLLLLWVGIGALMRGITEIIVAFQLRSADHHGAGPVPAAA
jgi:uncharacterized membrane protein HdeD (DUF308 family)